MLISKSLSRAPQDRTASPGKVPVKHQHRLEIEGLRGVAVLLVAVYHIWFGTVSGGVDVFFVLTGFLITGSLVRTVEREGFIDPLAFLARLAKRLFPTAAVVMAAVLVGAALFLPRSRWTEVVADTVASALYFQNWHLALNSVDYLAQNNGASPLQHFWSLAVQGQFYLLWLILVTSAALIARRGLLPLRATVLLCCSTVFVTSLSYSVYLTFGTPEWAYFDTGTRLWELALGGVLAMAVPHLRFPRALRFLMGWSGLIALVLCGLLAPTELPFPGFIALWPTLAAVVMILAGTTDYRVGADRLLTWRPLTRVGGMAYALFLWHWPILIFYLEVTERVRPSFSGGICVLALCLVLAWVTDRLVETVVTRTTKRSSTSLGSFALASALLAPVLVAALGWQYQLDHQARVLEAQSQNSALYPGAAVLADPSLAEGLPTLPVYPPTDNARESTVVETDDCNVGVQGSEPIICTFGSEDAEHTIALVGSSHSRHWFQALEEISREHDWRLVTILKSSCHFSAEPQMLRGEPFTACIEWNADAYAWMETDRPDTVFTMATRSDPHGDGAERIPDGFQERWHQLDELGIQVVALRDTPRLGFDAPECVDRNGRDTCTARADYSLAAVSPIDAVKGEHPNVTFLDLNDYLCPSGVCDSVIGNTLAYHDDNHFTAHFSRSMSLLLEPLLVDAIS
ncbi:acyltransferase family protein [Nocardiopsis quinghaiensis]|uniref:acyltransferase family protein n=1 Tax=Nocardiopsis quinghaiensis TaxID=464995 RepID=UPI001CC24145|nr:acyltransferase family protein [Nocardiopsis quinghaiensis]